MLSEQRKAIPGGEKFLKKHKICDLHFDESDVITEFITKMPDGTQHRLKRDRAILNKGAIPKYFSALTYQKVDEIAEEAILQRTRDNTTKDINTFMLFEGAETDFKEIANFPDKIPLPSEYWFVNSVDTFIQWSSYFDKSNFSKNKGEFKQNNKCKYFF